MADDEDVYDITHRKTHEDVLMRVQKCFKEFGSIEEKLCDEMSRLKEALQLEAQKHEKVKEECVKLREDFASEVQKNVDLKLEIDRRTTDYCKSIARLQQEVKDATDSDLLHTSELEFTKHKLVEVQASYRALEADYFVLKDAQSVVATPAMQCVVCLTDKKLGFDMMVTKCGHVLCTTCAARVWGGPCPYCRTKLDMHCMHCGEFMFFLVLYPFFEFHGNFILDFFRYALYTICCYQF